MRQLFLIFLLICPGFACAEEDSDEVSFPIVFPLIAPKLSSKYGQRKHPINKVVRDHNGVDLAAPMNTHVRAVADGVIIYADTFGGYGKLVSIMHKDNHVSIYGHLYELRMNVGDTVKAGQIIGRVGSTGKSTGPHLHLEWRHNGKPVDPLKIFPSLTAEPMG